MFFRNVGWLQRTTLRHVPEDRTVQNHRCENLNATFILLDLYVDRLYGLVVRVPGYLSRGLGFDYRRYQIFWEVMGLERGPLSLVSITDELLEWKSSGSGSRKSRLTAVGIRCADHVTPICPQKFSVSSPTNGGRSVGIFRLRTKVTEFRSICQLLLRMA
jgi:hypothetical protein